MPDDKPADDDSGSTLDPAIRQLIRALAHMQADADDAREMERLRRAAARPKAIEEHQVSEVTKRPFEGQELHNILKELAYANVIAGTMKSSLDPLSEDDVAMGAEPLTPDQIKADLDKIMDVLAKVAVLYLKATREEWQAADDEIE